MNISEIFHQLEKEYPQRLPGSAGAAATAEIVKNQIAALGFTAETQKISVYSLQTSIWGYVLGSLLSMVMAYFSPIVGLIMAGLFWLLLLKEPFRPTLAKIRPGRAENIHLNIPARSKESQKIVFLTGLVTDNFAEHPFKQHSRFFISLVWLCGLAFYLMLIFSAYHRSVLFTLLTLIPILIIVILNIPIKEAPASGVLSNCSLLLEVSAILAKAGVNTTSITFCFTGTNSLNSGIDGLPKRLKGNPELKYVVNLVDWADKRINLVTTDGLLFPLQTDPFLVESFMEVAREKGVPVQTIKLSEVSASYSLKLRKLKAISVTNPLDSAESNKNLRELIIGFIRKLDN